MKCNQELPVHQDMSLIMFINVLFGTANILYFYLKMTKYRQKYCLKNVKEWPMEGLTGGVFFTLDLILGDL